jgi:hypothetical protein
MNMVPKEKEEALAGGAYERGFLLLVKGLQQSSSMRMTLLRISDVTSLPGWLH